MRRFLPVIPILFLMLLNACGSFSSPTVVPGYWQTSVIQSLTATLWTPMPTQTYNPNIPTMVNWLNADLSTINSLEWTLDAEYYVTNVSFPNIPNSLALVFRLDVRCECVNGTECCIPERIFVAIMGSMKRNAPTILAQVPGGVNQMLVVCSKSKTHIGTMSASWQDVRDYLLGYLTGYQFGERVTRALVP